MKSALKMSMFFILIILLTSPNLFAQKEVSGSAEQGILLTASEKAWLKAHPDIVLGYTDSLEPDVIVNSDGTYSGTVFDILNELNEKLGTNIRLGIYPIPKLLKNAQERKVDGIFNIHPEYSEELGLLTTQAFWPAYMTVFARKGVLFDGPEDFSGKRVAVIDGVYFTRKYMAAYGKQATIVKVKDALTGLQSVDKGDVDYFLGASYNAYYIPKYQLFDVFTPYVFWDVPEMFGIAVRSDWPQLVSILNKWISNLSKEEIHAIVTKWSNLPGKQEKIKLTPEEQGWLKAHPDITLAYTDSLEPTVIAGPNGTHTGMLVDALEQLNQRLGTRIKLRLYDIPTLIENAKSKKVDGIISIYPDYAEKLGLRPTKVYWPEYLAVFARRGTSFEGVEDFAGKRVALIDKVYTTRKMIDDHGKRTTVVKVKTALDGLRAVAKGDADLFLGASYNSYYLPKYQLLEIVPVHVFLDTPAWQCVGVRSDWPELATILNKGLAQFSQSDAHNIIRKWSYLPADRKRLELTDEEQAWLKAHPIITLGGGNFPPLDFFDETKGQSDGIGPDYAKLIGSMLGIEFKLVSGDWQEILDMAKSKEIDGIRLIFKNKEREKYLNYTQPCIKLAHAIVTQKKTRPFSSLKDLSHKQVATLRGLYAYHYMKEHYPDIDLVDYPTWEDVLGALANGDVEAVVGTLPVITYMINKLFITNLKVTALPPEMDRDVYLGIRPDWPELTGIINKAIDAITMKQHSEIKQKWVGLNKKDKKIKISITPEEQAWIAENHTIRVRVTDSAPYLYSEKGRAVGIAVDLLKVVSESTGIKFHFIISSPPFAQDLKGLIQHTGPDLIATLMPTPEREKNILFTDIYISSPWFIFTRDDAPFVASMNDLNGRTVAVVKDYLVHEDIIKNYPDIELLICKNNKEALSAVSLGKAFAFIGDLMSTPAMINKFGLNNLKAVSPGSLQEHKTAMGIRSDWPELRDIISKVLDSMPASEKTAIINKWASVKFDYGISSADVKKWVLISGSIAALILFLIVFWNRSLTRKVEERTTTLAESEERFRATFEQAAVGIAHVSPEGRFLRINQKFCDIVGYSLEEMLALTFQEITHPDDLDADVEHVQCLLRGEAETYSIEKRYIYKNGETVWVNLTVSLIRKKNGEPSWFVAVVEDITPRKLAEEALRESEEKFRNLMEQSSLSIQILGVDGRIIQVNEAWKKLWGFSDELLQEVLEKYNILEDEEAIELGVMPLIEKAFAGESVILPVIEYDAAVTVERIGVSGSESNKRWIEVRLYPIKNSFGEVVNIVDIEEDITERKQAEKEILRYHERLKALAFQLTVTEEKERRRIADDLHDQIGQSLALARMQIASAKKSATDAGQAAKLDDISEILREAVHDTRHLMFDLSPPAMHQFGLGAAISEWLEDQIEKRYGIKTEFFDNIDEGHRKVLDENVRAILFRNVRELLINVVKHAQANQVTVLMEVTDGVLKIVVQDDGVGFDSRELSQPEGIKRGFGLFSIEERMTDLGGALEIESQPGKGGRAILTVPLELSR